MTPLAIVAALAKPVVAIAVPASVGDEAAAFGAALHLAATPATPAPDVAREVPAPAAIKPARTLGGRGGRAVAADVAARAAHAPAAVPTAPQATPAAGTNAGASHHPPEESGVRTPSTAADTSTAEAAFAPPPPAQNAATRSAAAADPAPPAEAPSAPSRRVAPSSPRRATSADAIAPLPDSATAMVASPAAAAVAPVPRTAAPAPVEQAAAPATKAATTAAAPRQTVPSDSDTPATAPQAETPRIPLPTPPRAAGADASVPAPAGPTPTATIQLVAVAGPVAAAPATHTATPAPVASPVEQVAATVRVAFVGPATHVTVTLAPRDLGTVEIHVARRSVGPATVALAVERPETLALLRRDAPALQSALDRAGVPVAPQHVTMTLATPEAPTLGTGAQGDPRAPPQRPEPQRAAAALSADPTPPELPDRVPAPTRAGIDITA